MSHGISDFIHHLCRAVIIHACRPDHSDDPRYTTEGIGRCHHTTAMHLIMKMFMTDGNGNIVLMIPLMQPFGDCLPVFYETQQPDSAKSTINMAKTIMPDNRDIKIQYFKVHELELPEEETAYIKKRGGVLIKYKPKTR